MSLYFFLRMETWSLKSTGSSLIWECTSGMNPSQRLKTFMQVCRWAKWSGSAHRDTLELWVYKDTQGKNRLASSSHFTQDNTVPPPKLRNSAATCECAKLVKGGSQLEKGGVLLWVGEEILPRSGGVQGPRALVHELRENRARDRQAASTLMRALPRSVVVEIYQSIFVPSLTCGHELWVVTRKNEVVGTSG